MQIDYAIIHTVYFAVILQALVDKQSPSLLRKQFLVQLQLLQPKDVFVSFITVNSQISILVLAYNANIMY